MRTYLLEEMTWPEIKAQMEAGKRTVIIMAASIEQHGPHLAEATDTILGYAEAIDLAERLGNAFVAPVIRPGLSEHHMARCRAASRCARRSSEAWSKTMS